MRAIFSLLFVASSVLGMAMILALLGLGYGFYALDLPLFGATVEDILLQWAISATLLEYAIIPDMLLRWSAAVVFPAVLVASLWVAGISRVLAGR